MLQITKAIHAFMREHADGVRDSVTEDKETTRSSEKLDALEVKLGHFYEKTQGVGQWFNILYLAGVYEI